MRDFAKVSPKFWIGPTGKQIKKAGAEATIVAFYLMTSPHSHMTGLYYLPTPYLVHETGLGLEGACKGLQRCCEAGFCSYDAASEMVWVHEMAAYQIGEVLKPNDKRVAGLQAYYNDLPENPFLSEFYDCYAEAFHLRDRRCQASPFEAPSMDLPGAYEAPSMTLGSKEKEKEKETETETVLAVCWNPIVEAETRACGREVAVAA